jgi:hypothetical protein
MPTAKPQGTAQAVRKTGLGRATGPDNGPSGRLKACLGKPSGNAYGVLRGPKLGIEGRGAREPGAPWLEVGKCATPQGP